jgi:aspartate aminotransferase
MLELREAVADKFKEEKEIPVTPDQVIVSPGAKYSLFLALQTLVDEGEEVILPAPYWVSYPEQIKFAGGQIKPVAAREENDFKLTAEQLKEAISPATAGLVLNSPANPTGAVYDEAEIREIAEVVVEEDIFVIADEIYGKLSYEQEAVSIASLNPEIRERTVTIDGVSKAYSMTGWRIGYAVGAREVVEAMNCLQSHSTSNPTSISQQASLAALLGSQKPTEKMREAFKERRNLIVEEINQVPGLQAHKPKGAFYLFVNVKEVLGRTIKGTKLTNDKEVADLLLEEAGVAVTPGSFFGKEGYFRLSYAVDKDTLREAVSRIETLLST